MNRTCTKEGCNNHYDPYRNRYSRPGRSLEFNISYQKRCKDSKLCEDCLAKEVQMDLDHPTAESDGDVPQSG